MWMVKVSDKNLNLWSIISIHMIHIRKNTALNLSY